MSADASNAENVSLDRADTLPAEWYTSENLFAQETARIFRRTWQYVGHLGQVAVPGDFFTAQLGDIPIVVTRAEDGAVHAMANVCRHRASEVVLQCSGNRKTLQCHYHGWTYNLDGSLRAAPRAAEQESFHKEALSLVPFAIETWGPMIFVNPDPAAGPLHELIGELPVMFQRSGVDVDRLWMRRRDSYDLAANWKITVENFNECYHCPIAHPKFSEVIDTDAYTCDVSHEYYSTYYGPIIGAPDNGVTYATLWPTAMFALTGQPVGAQVMRAWPLDVDHTRVTIDYFFPVDVGEEEMRAYAEFSDLVQREDMVLCESVQRGLRSGIVKQGRLMLSREQGIQHFQNLVRRFINGTTD